MNIKRIFLGLCLAIPLLAGSATAEPIGGGHLLAVFSDTGTFDRETYADTYTVARMFEFGPGDFPDGLTISSFPAFFDGTPLPEMPFGEFFLLGAVFSPGTGPSHLLLTSGSGSIEPDLAPIGEPLHGDLIAGSSGLALMPPVFGMSALGFWSEFSADAAGFASMFFDVPVDGDGSEGPIGRLSADGGFEGGEDIFGFSDVFKVGFVLGRPGAPAFLNEDGVLFTPVTPIPEPTSLVLMGLGLVGVVAARRRRRAA